MVAPLVEYDLKGRNKVFHTATLDPNRSLPRRKIRHEPRKIGGKETVFRIASAFAIAFGFLAPTFSGGNQASFADSGHAGNYHAKINNGDQHDLSYHPNLAQFSQLATATSSMISSPMISKAVMIAKNLFSFKDSIQTSTHDSTRHTSSQTKILIKNFASSNSAKEQSASRSNCDALNQNFDQPVIQTFDNKDGTNDWIITLPDNNLDLNRVAINLLNLNNLDGNNQQLQQIMLNFLKKATYPPTDGFLNLTITKVDKNGVGIVGQPSGDPNVKDLYLNTDLLCKAILEQLPIKMAFVPDTPTPQPKQLPNNPINSPSPSGLPSTQQGLQSNGNIQGQGGAAPTETASPTENMTPTIEAPVIEGGETPVPGAQIEPTTTPYAPEINYPKITWQDFLRGTEYTGIGIVSKLLSILLGLRFDLFDELGRHVAKLMVQNFFEHLLGVDEDSLKRKKGKSFENWSNSLPIKYSETELKKLLAKFSADQISKMMTDKNYKKIEAALNERDD
ncbi:hypothetical protein M1328_00450 [Patescibacteria group bacterium]|nr:hypothetical protein [Patescibacteria group bacterium]